MRYIKTICDNRFDTVMIMDNEVGERDVFNGNMSKMR